MYINCNKIYKKNRAAILFGKVLFIFGILATVLFIFSNKDLLEYKKNLIFRSKFLNHYQIYANDSRLIDYLRSHYLIRPSTKPYNLSRSKFYQRTAKMFTWKFADQILKVLFDKEPPGFFVEAGALDGEYLSNTLGLEKEKGWTGLLIEPDSVSYMALQAKNRKAWSINCCLGTAPFPEKMNFVINDFTPEQKENWNDAMWIYRSHTYELKSGLAMSGGPYEGFHKIYKSVQCFPLESLLLALNVTIVDFLSLDIQGGEWEVLKFFPWDRIKVRTMAVEYVSNNTLGQIDSTFVNFLNQKDFKLVGMSNESDYFVVNKYDKLMKLINENTLLNSYSLHNMKDI